MNETLPFGHTRARTTDPVSSKIAASNAETFAGTHKEIVRQGLELFPDGATQTELAEVLTLTREQINRCLPDLEREGVAVVTGEYRDNANDLPDQVFRLARPGDTPRDRSRTTVAELEREMAVLKDSFAVWRDEMERKVSELEALWPK